MAGEEEVPLVGQDGEYGGGDLASAGERAIVAGKKVSCSPRQMKMVGLTWAGSNPWGWDDAGLVQDPVAALPVGLAG